MRSALVWIVLLTARETRVESLLSRRECRVGEAVTLELCLLGDRVVDPVVVSASYEAAADDGLLIRPAGPWRSRVLDGVPQLFMEFEVKALRPGEHVVPAIDVLLEAEGRTLGGTKVVLRVHGDGGPAEALRITATPAAVFPFQTSHLQLSPIGAARPAVLELRSTHAFRIGGETLFAADARGRTHAAGERLRLELPPASASEAIELAFTPRQGGPPLRLEASLHAAGREPAFQPVPLTLRDIPRDGRPADYAGIIGTYRVVSPPPSLLPDGAVQLLVEWVGDGNLENHELVPALRVPSEWILRESRPGGDAAGATFEYILVRRGLTDRIERQAWSVFDPGQGAFVSVELPAQRLTPASRPAVEEPSPGRLPWAFGLLGMLVGGLAVGLLHRLAPLPTGRATPPPEDPGRSAVAPPRRTGNWTHELARLVGGAAEDLGAPLGARLQQAGASAELASALQASVTRFEKHQFGGGPWSAEDEREAAQLLEAVRRLPGRPASR